MIPPIKQGMNMEKDLAAGKIGAIGSYDIEIKDGKLQGKAGVDHEYGKAGMFFEIPGQKLKNALVDALEVAIPGDQKMIAELLKSVLDKVLF